jgi:hypothetical protein
MSAPTPIVGLDSLEVAQQVIRSFRCKSTSQSRHFSDQTSLGATDLNRLIDHQQRVAQQHSDKIQTLSDAIGRYAGPTPTHSATAKNTLSSPLRSQSARQQATHNDNDDSNSDNEFLDSSDEDSSKVSKGRKSRFLRDAVRSNRQQKEEQDFLQRCEYDILERSAKPGMRAHSTMTATTACRMDLDDFDDDDDDDDHDKEDMKALFKDFVPPTKRGNINKTNNNNSVKRSGNNATNLLVESSKKGITIKPGQAIRVKPSGNKNKKPMGEF